MRSPGLIVTTCLLIFGCSDVSDKSATDKSGNSSVDKTPVVVVTSQPLFEMTTLLAGDQIVVKPVQTLWLIELRATKGGGHSH